MKMKLFDIIECNLIAKILAEVEAQSAQLQDDRVRLDS